MVSIFQVAAGDFLCKSRNKAPPKMCKDTQIKLSFLKACALHPQISPSP